MVIITHHRDKCIGCNYCVEEAPERWAMSQKDGKCILIDSRESKGFFTVRVHDDELEKNLKAAESCPVNIIYIKKI